MKEKSFIVKMGERYAFFLVGTMEELKRKLESLGAIFVGDRKVNVVDLGKKYTTELTTRIYVQGHNPEAHHDICKKIEIALNDYPNLAKQLINSYNGKQLIDKASRSVPFYTGKVSILVSSGKHLRRNEREIKVDELSPRLFWKKIEEYLYYSKASLFE